MLYRSILLNNKRWGDDVSSIGAKFCWEQSLQVLRKQYWTIPEIIFVCGVFSIVLYCVCFRVHVCVSGIMAILFCGIVMSHYTHLNLSPVAQITTQLTFRTIAFIAGFYLSLYTLLVSIIAYCLCVQQRRALKKYSWIFPSHSCTFPRQEIMDAWHFSFAPKFC